MFNANAVGRYIIGHCLQPLMRLDQATALEPGEVVDSDPETSASSELCLHDLALQRQLVWCRRRKDRRDD